ncbi:uncharacterized protein [Lolium perenne]|uniref:uncharacterized protein isoform X7 n=1 Tax=Lolium perenne TaxID=4522 RepID=UPI003A999026
MDGQPSAPQRPSAASLATATGGMEMKATCRATGGYHGSVKKALVQLQAKSKIALWQSTLYEYHESLEEVSVFFVLVCVQLWLFWFFMVKYLMFYVHGGRQLYSYTRQNEILELQEGI